MKLTQPIALLLPLGILAAPRLAAAEFSAVVAGVHDGDTLTVRKASKMSAFASAESIVRK